MMLFHRTAVSQAREIVRDGFRDEKWSFGPDEQTGRPLLVRGVWLTDRPVNREDGPPGAALLEVSLGIEERELTAFEVTGVFDDARLWIIPASVVNQTARVRIGEVDGRSSWFHEQVEEEESGG